MARATHYGPPSAPRRPGEGENRPLDPCLRALRTVPPPRAARQTAHNKAPPRFSSIQGRKAGGDPNAVFGGPHLLLILKG